MNTGHTIGSGRRQDRRARSNAPYWAFLLHRVSGLLLALFLPVHFLLLGQALNGADALDRGLRLTDLPLVKFAEWGLVVLLALHLAGGLRVLVLEFRPWSGARKNWITAALGFAAVAGLVFALALVS